LSQSPRIQTALLLAAFSIFWIGCGSSSTKTNLRALEASPNESATLNILVDGSTLFSNLGLGVPSSYSSVISGSHTLAVEASNSSTTLLSQSFTLNSSTNYTLIIANYAASLTPIMLTDNTTAPSSGNFNLRIVNAAVEAGSVDIYIQAPGSTSPSTGAVAPTISNLGFTSSSTYESLAAGSWNVIVTPAGYPVVNYINTGSLSFSAGQNRTLVILPDGNGGITSVTLSDLN
jgi:hypothetical protein